MNYHRIFFLALILILGTGMLQAQKYFTKDGKISFFSDAPLEKIEAHNNKASSVLDAETGNLEFAVLIKAFHFEKALMQEHFNENYLESNKYPKATFKGTITNMDDVDFTSNGKYEAMVEGNITIHGVTKPLSTKAHLTVKDGEIHAVSNFELTVADFEIEIPKVVRDNIAKAVRVDLEIDYQEMKS